MNGKNTRVLAVCSGGGHSIQLESLLQDLHLEDVTVASPANFDFRKKDIQVLNISDCNIRSPAAAVICTLQLLKILVSYNPGLIISTGAAPGGIAIFIGKILGIKGFWIDSIANAEKPSLTGKLIRPFCSIWISQWENVAEKYGGEYYGPLFNLFKRRNSATLRPTGEDG